MFGIPAIAVDYRRFMPISARSITPFWWRVALNGFAAESAAAGRWEAPHQLVDFCPHPVRDRVVVSGGDNLVHPLRDLHHVVRLETAGRHCGGADPDP